MNFNKNRLFVALLFILLHLVAVAQDKYKAEIGIAGGGAFYLGDANSRLFGNTQSAFSGFFRYKLNPRIAFRLEAQNTAVVGVGYNNSIFATDVCGEFNFFDLESNPNKRSSRRYSTYIFTGLGGMVEMYTGQQWPAFTIPFGVGVKVKLAQRLNFNVQWAQRLLLASDKMENNPLYNNPNDLNGTNWLRNDLLSSLTVGVSYDIWKKGCNCRNNSY